MKADLKVELMACTPDAERLIASAAKLCYSNVGVTEIREGLTDEQVNKFVNMLMNIGHESPIEHVSFTFGIEGVSRVLTHQLVRHRIASYSQQSQRYVSLGSTFSYVVPPMIYGEDGDNEANRIFENAMEDSHLTYSKLVDILIERNLAEMLLDRKDIPYNERLKVAEKKAIEDARFVLPNACETKIVMTMNARSLINFLAHRTCERAQWEIRALATEIAHIVIGVAPSIFKKVGPPCLYGACLEGSMSCGKQKLKKIEWDVN